MMTRRQNRHRPILPGYPALHVLPVRQTCRAQYGRHQSLHICPVRRRWSVRMNRTGQYPGSRFS